MGKQADKPEMGASPAQSEAARGLGVTANTRERFYEAYEAALHRKQHVEALELLEERVAFDAQQLLRQEGVQLPWLLNRQGRDGRPISLAATAHAAIRVLKRMETAGEADAPRVSKIKAAARAMLSVHQLGELRQQVNRSVPINAEELARLMLTSAIMGEANLIMGVIGAGWIATLEDHAARVDRQSRAGLATRDRRRSFKQEVLTYAKTLPSALSVDAMAKGLHRKFGRPKEATLVKWIRAARKSGELPSLNVANVDDPPRDGGAD